MSLHRLLTSAFATVILSCVAGSFGCSGKDGAAGPAGPQGPGADAGIPEGGTGCTAPCHGFGNIVDQWRYSKHYITAAVAAGEPAWTSAGPCGNCHAINGLELRIAGSVGVADGGVPVDVPKGHLNYKTGAGSITEIGYAGLGKTAVIHCTTCHDFNSKNDPHNTGSYILGSAPQRVAVGADDFAMLEASPSGASAPVGRAAGRWKTGNTCVMCHKSRKDVTFFITASNKLSSNYWGPHEGPQADIYSGLGGYPFAGVTYGTSVHSTLSNGCTSCHMHTVATNLGTPDHSMHPEVTYCKTCHTTYNGTTFDIQSGQSLVRGALRELEAALNARGFLTRSRSAPYAPLRDTDLSDGNFHSDLTRPASGAGGADQVLDAPTAGALYNYLLMARSKDFGVHNPTYEKQLLWDSIKTIKGSNPTSLSSRPN